MLDISRRGLIGIFAAGVSAAIVRPGLLMPVKKIILGDGVALKNVAHPIPEYRWFLIGGGQVKLFTRHKFEPNWRETVDMPFGVADIRAAYASRGLSISP